MNNGMVGGWARRGRRFSRVVDDLIIVNEVQAGIYAGNLTGSAWYTRPLNTIHYDSAGIASVANSRVKVPPGSYEVEGWTMQMGGNRAKPRVRDVTRGVSVARGPQIHSQQGGNDWPVQCVLFAVGRFTAPMDVELEVQQFVQSTVSDTWNAGHGGMEAPYVFAQLMLRRYAA